MDVPLEVAYRRVESTEALEEAISAGVRGLEKVYDRLTSCRIMVEDVDPDRTSGKLYQIRIDMTVPGNELVVKRKPSESPPDPDIFVAVDDAFDIARRRLRKWVEKRRGQ